MSGPRSTNLWNTLLDATSTPVQGVLVSLQLTPTTVPITYNVADSFLDTTVSSSPIKTRTANTAPAAPTAAHVAGSTSMPAGTPLYKVSCLYTGSDGVSYESAASVASNAITVSSGDTVNLTAIPLGGTGCTARRIYRTDDTGANYGLLHTIADNTTTTYADGAADSSRNTNIIPLGLGGWQVAAIALGDILPSSGVYYVVTEGTVVNQIQTFAYSATLVQASTLYAGSAAGSTPTSNFTGYVLDSSGNLLQGVPVTAKLSQDGVSTVTGYTVKSNNIISVVTNSGGEYILPLVPTDRMTPSGLYYTVTEGPNATPKTILAPNGGGSVNSLITTPASASPTVKYVGAEIAGGTNLAAVTINSNAGTGAAKTGGLVSTEMEGQIGWTSGSGSWATGAQIGTTFTYTRGAAPRIHLIPVNAAAFTAWNAGHVSYTSSTTGFTINLSVADSGATTYLFNYSVWGV